MLSIPSERFSPRGLQRRPWGVPYVLKGESVRVRVWGFSYGLNGENVRVRAWHTEYVVSWVALWARGPSWPPLVFSPRGL